MADLVESLRDMESKLADLCQTMSHSRGLVEWYRTRYNGSDPPNLVITTQMASLETKRLDALRLAFAVLKETSAAIKNAVDL